MPSESLTPSACSEEVCQRSWFPGTMTVSSKLVAAASSVARKVAGLEAMSPGIRRTVKHRRPPLLLGLLGLPLLLLWLRAWICAHHCRTHCRLAL